MKTNVDKINKEFFYYFFFKKLQSGLIFAEDSRVGRRFFDSLTVQVKN